MASKNNPENRGRVTELRVYDGQKVKPVLYISGKNRYIGSMFEATGELVLDKNTGLCIPYQSI